MYWESDRDERLLSEMYGLTELYVYPLEKPDPDADNQSYYQPDYLSESAVPVGSLSVGDLFPTVDSLDSQFSPDDLGPVELSGIVADALSLEVQPPPPVSLPDSSLVVPVSASVPAEPQFSEAPVLPPGPIGDMFGSVEELDGQFQTAISPPSLSGVSTATFELSVDGMDGAAQSMFDMDLQLQSPADLPSSLDFGGEPDATPVGRSSVRPTSQRVVDRRPPRGQPPQATASQFHQPRGRVGGQPITGGGMPDVRFSSRVSDGTEFGDSLASGEAAMAIYVNNLTQALGAMAELLVDHAQRIHDIEEIIERSC